MMQECLIITNCGEICDELLKVKKKGGSDEMSNGTYSIFISKLGAILLLACLMLTACNQKETRPSSMAEEETCNQEEVRPFTLSEEAVEYSFSVDNIMSLKSIILDNTDTDNRFILEFDSFSEYIYKDGMEETLKVMEEEPHNLFRRIIGESVDYVTCTDVQVMYDKDSIFLILYFEPNIECNRVVIYQGNITMEINAPWEKPSLLVMDISYMQDGTEGVLFRSQEYDVKSKKWNESVEQFAEDKPPVGD